MSNLIKLHEVEIKSKVKVVQIEPESRIRRRKPEIKHKV